MVVIQLNPHRGNGARSFPHTGYLGLTPVTFAGVVRTVLEEDQKVVQASSVVVRVRCYETLTHGAGTGSANPSANATPPDSPQSPATADKATKSSAQGRGAVLWEKAVTVWAPPTSSSSLDVPFAGPSHRPSSANRQYAPLGDFEKSFRIVIPPEAVEQGAKSTMVFKKWRIWWTIEAVISHVPSGVHGDRIIRSQQIALLNYAPPDLSSALQWSSTTNPSQSLDYNITGNVASFGSNDRLSLAVRLQRTGRSDAPKKVSVELRREIVFHHSSEDVSPSCHSESLDSRSHLAASRRSSSSAATPHQRRLRSASKPSRPSSDTLMVESGTYTPLSRRPKTPPASVTTPSEYQGPSSADSYFSSFGQQPSLSPSASSSAPSSTAWPHFSPLSLSIPSRPGSALQKRKKDDVALASFAADLQADGSDIWRCELSGNMPKAKSLYHYALGESCSTAAASSRFYLVVRIHFRSKNNLIELPPQDIDFTTVSAEDREKAAQQLPRIFAIQQAEVKLFGSDCSDGVTHFPSDTQSAEQRGRLSNVRRRSEHPDALDSPRTRQRFVSEACPPRPSTSAMIPPFPVSLSVPSVSTAQRPRTAGPRKPGSSAHSLRGPRPRSSGGLSSTSSVRTSSSSVCTNPLQHFALSSPSSTPVSISSLHSSSEKAEEEENLAPVVDFSTFSLCVPENKHRTGSAPLLLPPISPRLASSSSGRTSRTEMQHNSHQRPDSSPEFPVEPLLAVSPASAVSELPPSYQPFQSSLPYLVETPAFSRQAGTVSPPSLPSRTFSQASQELLAPLPLATPKPPSPKSKISSSGFASFFRRGSKVSV